MKPFHLRDHTEISEIFRKDFSEDWPAGAFDYQLSFYEINKKKTDILCEWLSINCKENFIVSRKSSAIIAGGTTNNELAWMQRHKHTYDKGSDKIKVRLHECDTVMFRLSWIL